MIIFRHCVLLCGMRNVVPPKHLSILRFNLISTAALCFIVLVLGCGLNNLGHKYSRSWQKGNSCDVEVFILGLPHSQLCCSDFNHEWDWICTAVVDKAGHILSSHWAVLLPLVPLLLTFVTEVAFKCNRHLFIRSSQRLMIYICIIAYRTVK